METILEKVDGVWSVYCIYDVLLNCRLSPGEPLCKGPGCPGCPGCLGCSGSGLAVQDSSVSVQVRLRAA